MENVEKSKRNETYGMRSETNRENRRKNADERILGTMIVTMEKKEEEEEGESELTRTRWLSFLVSGFSLHAFGHDCGKTRPTLPSSSFCQNC